MASGVSLLTQTRDLWREEKKHNSRLAAGLLYQWHKFNWGLVCHACLWWSERLHLQKKESTYRPSLLLNAIFVFLSSNFNTHWRNCSSDALGLPPLTGGFRASAVRLTPLLS